MIIAEAIRETGSTDPDVLANHIQTLKKYEGVSGTLISDGKGGIEKNTKVTKVIDGRALPID
jgi:hypothetical protein